MLRKIALLLGVTWIALIVATGVWLGFSGLFLDQPRLLFESGFGDIWILAICAAPGYLLCMWGATPKLKED